MSNMIAYEQLTVSSTAVKFTEGTVTHRVRMAIIQVRAAPVRYRGDATAPTASTGLSLQPGERLILVGEGTVHNAQFIREGSTDATVEGAFFDAVDAVQMVPSPSGEIAHDAVETGVLGLPLSAYAVSSAPAQAAAGDRVRVPAARRGYPLVSLAYDDLGVNVLGTPADAQSNAVSSLVASALGWRFNGTTWDRLYNTVEGSLLASAARTATANSADQTNYNASGVLVYLRISAASGTGGLQLTVAGKDSVSGQYAKLNATPTAKTGTGLWVYAVGRGMSTAAGDIDGASATGLPRTWRIQVAVGDSSSYTYSVGYAYVL